MKPQIDADIPLPSRRGNGSKYPFHLMTVGDSFFVPDVKGATLSNAAGHWRKRGFNFAVRMVTEDGVRGARIWRTE